MKNYFKLFTVAATMSMASSTFAATPESAVWKDLSASDAGTYAIKADGTLWAWGSNGLGELGQGAKTPEKISKPVQIGTDSDWKAAYGARGCGFFIKENGSLWHVGSNEKGISGVADGMTEHTSITQVGTDTDWKEIYTTNAWGYTVLALKNDGTLWGWGSGGSFQLGQGNVNNSNVPIKINDDTDWKQISVGCSHVLAIKNDGTLWGWGFASHKQLMNSETNIKVPTQIGDPNDRWEQVWAVSNSSYGIKSDGKLYAWGDNSLNQLGLNVDNSASESDGYYENVPTATEVTAVTGRVTLLSGDDYTRVVYAGDKVYAWGANANGALGDGKGGSYEIDNYQMSYTPVEVLLTDGTNPVKISSGLRFSTLQDENGILYGWGANRWGQLGNCVDESGMTFEPTPIVMTVPAPPKPGEYTVDASDIPASLTDAVSIKMTGEWSTETLGKLCVALEANIGFPPVGNNKLEFVDMSEATFAANTSFCVPAGMNNVGVFKMCKALKTVKFPDNETAGNIVSLKEAFWLCTSLSSCDVAKLVNVDDISMAFYQSGIPMINMSNWNNVTKSEDAFGMCEKLGTVMLPANFTLSKYVFNSCTALRLIDWSNYAGTVAPDTDEKTNIFEHLTPEEQAHIVVKVPAAVYDSFKANITWQYVNLQPVGQAEPGVYMIDANNIPADLKDATKIILSGYWETENFKALSEALANNSAGSNNVLTTVDMSAAEIAPGTNLCASFSGIFGSTTKGIFQNCFVLSEIIFPAAEQAANFRQFEQAFFGCESLVNIDITSLTGINNTKGMFYGCTLLESVALSAAFAFDTETFDRCNNLSTIDWRTYEGIEAATYVSGSLPSRGKDLTIIVPDAAYDAFIADTNWNSFNIVNASSSSIESIGNNVEGMSARVVFDFNGRQVTVLAPGQDVNTLPAGLYIVDGKKVYVK